MGRNTIRAPRFLALICVSRECRVRESQRVRASSGGRSTHQHFRPGDPAVALNSPVFVWSVPRRESARGQWGTHARSQSRRRVPRSVNSRLIYFF